MSAFVARTREQVYAALFQVLVTGLTGNAAVPVTTFTRRFFDWQTMPAASQPVLLLLQGEERAARTHRGLVRWEYHAVVLYYFLGSSIGGNPPSVYPVTAVNGIVDAIETVLLTVSPTGGTVPPGDVQTLGGIVNDVYLEGEVSYDQQAFDVPGSQGLIAIPVVIECGQLA